MHSRVGHVLNFLCTTDQRCMQMWAMTPKDGVNLTQDSKSYPGRKKVPQSRTEWCMFRKKNLKGRSSEVTMFYEKQSVLVLQFNTHPLMDPVYKSSLCVFLRCSPYSMCCQYYSSFLLAVHSAQVSGNKYIELRATLQSKVYIVRCIGIQLSFQISRGEMSVCKVFEGPLFRIQFDWPKSICRPMCDSCHQKIVHYTSAWKSASGTGPSRFPVGAEWIGKISHIKSITVCYSLCLYS